MKMAKREFLLDILDDLDVRALVDFYYKRCLSREILEEFVYEGETNERLGLLSSHSLITIVDHKDGKEAFFLTSDGVSMAKYLISHDSRYKTSTIEKKACELLMSPIIISHQLALNKFSYLITRWARERGLAHTYCDQIYAPNLSQSMMTDGLLFLEDEVVLIETDMGTEKMKDMMVKWTNYTTFLHRPAEAYKDKKLKVLFVLENVENGQCRRISVFSSIHASLCTMLGLKFEIYAGTSTEMMKMLNGEYQTQVASTIDALMKNQGFNVIDTDFSFLEKEGDFGFDKYIYMDGIDGVQSVDGRVQEYVVDFWYDYRASILNKLRFYQSTSTVMEQVMGRKMGYVVVLPNERMITQLVKKAGLDVADNIFFTTEKRLKKNPWHKALFVPDMAQSIYQFEDASLREFVFQRKATR